MVEFRTIYACSVRELSPIINIPICILYWGLLHYNAAGPQILLNVWTLDHTTTLVLLRLMNIAHRVLLSLWSNILPVPAVSELMEVWIFILHNLLGRTISIHLELRWFWSLMHQAPLNCTLNWRSWRLDLLESQLLSFLAWVMWQTLLLSLLWLARFVVTSFYQSEKKWNTQLYLSDYLFADGMFTLRDCIFREGW